MTAAMNPAAPHYLPVFITSPSESDLFLNGAAIFLVAMVLGLGSVYFRLHALPEHLAHKNANKVQFEIVAVLALLGLFTHNNLFWVAALILALVPIPDFHGPLANMAASLARMAGYSGPPREIDSSAEAPAAVATPSHPVEAMATPSTADTPAVPEQTDRISPKE
ncbi:MAG: hypothetical protein M9924_11280 [Rhizobiaceae bacterium]|nr:hypothetical protein [Rhizobiaceae bacterium]